MSRLVLARTQLLVAQSVLNTTSLEVNLQPCLEYTIAIVFGAGTSAGAVQVESAHVAAYSGTWNAEGTPIVWAVVSSVKMVHITGFMPVLRLRISTAMVGGTVDAYIWGVDR